MSIKHQNNFATNLTANQAATTNIVLNDNPSVDPPYYLALDATDLNGKFEVIKVTSDDGAGTMTHAITSNAHTTSEEVRMVLPSEELNPTLTVDTYNANITLDLSTSLHQITMTGDLTTMTLSNETVGQTFVIRLVQPAAGSKVVTAWFTGIKWAGGVTPVLTTTGNKIDVFGFICTAAGAYDGFVVGQSL